MFEMPSNGARRTGRSLRCDYAQHIMVEGALPIDLPGQVGEAIQAGFATRQDFYYRHHPSRKGRMVDFGDIWEIFKVLAANKGLGVIHSEDNDIVMHMYAKLIREDRTGFENMAEVHNTLSEDVCSPCDPAGRDGCPAPRCT